MIFRREIFDFKTKIMSNSCGFVYIDISDNKCLLGTA